MEKNETDNLLREMGANCTLYEAYSILCRLVEMGEIHRDPNNRNNILVYVSDGPEGDGFYSQNIFSAANDLMFDPEGIDFLLGKIKESDPSFVPEKPPKLFFSKENKEESNMSGNTSAGNKAEKMDGNANKEVTE